MKKALILGGSGFVGGYLARELRANGYELTMTASGSVPAPEDYRWLQLDILDAEAVREAVSAERYDAVFHLAAQSSAALSWKKPELTMNVNMQGTLHVLEALRGLSSAPRLLVVGSSEEYGSVKPEECPIREEQPCHPGNPYALSKHCAEELALLYASAYGLDVICTRSFNHVGPGQAQGFVLSDFCRQIVLLEQSGQEGEMSVGNLSARRDFTDVRDVVRAYRLLAEQGRSGQVYNVGSGKAVSIRELLEELLSMAAVPIRAETDPAKLRPIDVPLHMADITKLTADTHWRPEIPLRETLCCTLDDFRRQLKGEAHA